MAPKERPLELESEELGSSLARAEASCHEQQKPRLQGLENAMSWKSGRGHPAMIWQAMVLAPVVATNQKKSPPPLSPSELDQMV